MLPVQLRCDEKGFVAVCAFGLPGQTHDDGPVRGVLAALQIADGMQASSEASTSRFPVVKSAFAWRTHCSCQNDLCSISGRRQLASVLQSV